MYNCDCNNNIGAGNITSTDNDQYLRVEWCDNVTDVPTKGTFLSKIKEITDNESDTSTKLDTEIERAKTAEQNITDNLNNEILERRSDDDKLQSQINVIAEKQAHQQDKVITRTLSENIVTETFDAPNSEQVLILQDENKTGSIRFDKDNNEVALISNGNFRVDSDNFKIKENNLTVGSQNSVGSYAFNVTGIVKNTDNTIITLDTSDDKFNNLAVGDRVSLRASWNKTGLTITEIDSTNKTITVIPALPSFFPDYAPREEDNYLWAVDKPLAGDVLIGSGSFAGGISGNRCNTSGGLSWGKDNIADGIYSVALGKNNKSGYNTISVGADNDCLLSEVSFNLGNGNKFVNGTTTYTFVTGSHNTVDSANSSLVYGLTNNVTNAQKSLIGGDRNTVTTSANSILSGVFLDANNYQNSIGVGQGLIVNGWCKAIFGHYNKVDNNIQFAVGAGGSDTTRRNVIEVFADGTGNIDEQGQSDKAIVQKQYADKISTKASEDLEKTKTWVTSQLDTKLNINKSKDQYNRVYAISAEGVNYVALASSEIVDGAVMRYQGTFKVNAPEVDENPATKKYVDDLTSANEQHITEEGRKREEADKELAQKIADITAVQIRNKSEVISSTEAEVQTTATKYIQDNYSREPQNWDGLIITVTDKNDGDKILYIYSDVSKLWINSGINDVDLSNYYTKDEIDNTVSTINQSVTDEIQARTEADVVLQNGITANEGLINKEINDRKEAVGDVTGELNKLIASTMSFDIYSSKTNYTNVVLVKPTKDLVYIDPDNPDLGDLEID